MLWQESTDLVGHELKEDKKVGGDWVGSGRGLSGKWEGTEWPESFQQEIWEESEGGGNIYCINI